MRKVRCPYCGKIIEYSLENPYRPFCTERCKMIDLGEWADEKFKIPTKNLDQEMATENDDPEVDDSED